MAEPTPEAGTDLTPEPDVAGEPLPTAVEENTGGVPTESEERATERPELPPLPSAELQPAMEVPASSTACTGTSTASDSSSTEFSAT